jgi:hypothetical protein
MFRHPIAVDVGETITRDSFVFCDLIPSPHSSVGRGLG